MHTAATLRAAHRGFGTPTSHKKPKWVEIDTVARRMLMRCITDGYRRGQQWPLQWSDLAAGERTRALMRSRSSTDRTSGMGCPCARIDVSASWSCVHDSLYFSSIGIPSIFRILPSASALRLLWRSCTRSANGVKTLSLVHRIAGGAATCMCDSACECAQHMCGWLRPMMSGYVTVQGREVTRDSHPSTTPRDSSLR